MVVGISGQLVALDVFLSRWATEGPADARAASSHASSGDMSSTLASQTISPFAMPAGAARMAVRFDLASAQLHVIGGRLLAFVQGNPHTVRLGLSFPPFERTTNASNNPTTGASGTGGGAASYLPPATVSSASPTGASAVPGLGPAAYVQPAPAPEPTTIALVGSGLLLGAMGRRRLRRKESEQK
jgi:hypothetical protein